MATFYISNAGSDSANGTSTSTPWKTLSKVQSSSSSIKAGDSVLFNKGDTFIGTFNWSKSGTSSAPITFGAYGTGAKPIFKTTTSSRNQILFHFSNLSYVILDGLAIVDSSDPNDKSTAAYCGYGVLLGDYGSNTCNSCTVVNCDIIGVGNAVELIGNYNLIDKCNITDLKGVVNDSSNDNDYGANGVTIVGSNNTISNNYFARGYYPSIDYGMDGGVIEFYDSCNNNKILNNTMVDCCGVSEYGAGNSNQSSTGNLFAYNKIINCGAMAYANMDGQYTVNVTNIQFYNNTVIETANSRYSGPSSNGTAYKTYFLFSYSGTPTGNMFDLKNNIFKVANSIGIVRTSAASKTTHANNIYQLTGGALGYTIGSSELSTTAALFTDITPADPSNWDLTLKTGSPAINFGQSITGLIKDFVGNSLDATPDAGIYEKSAGVSTLQIAVTTADVFLCGFPEAVVFVNATGGTPPYTGAPKSYNVAPGTYTYTVTDSLSATSSQTITLVNPSSPISFTWDYAGQLIPLNETVKVGLTITGGIPPYSYYYDNTKPITSGKLDMPIGSHLITVLDSRHCILSKSIFIDQGPRSQAPAPITVMYNSYIAIYLPTAGTFTITKNGTRLVKGRYKAFSGNNPGSYFSMYSFGKGNFIFTTNGQNYPFTIV